MSDGSLPRIAIILAIISLLLIPETVTTETWIQIDDETIDESLKTCTLDPITKTLAEGR